MILIFTEIIELNFCELSKNTKRNINERASIVEESVNNLEKILINDDNDNNSDDNNINDNDNNDNNLDNSKEVDAWVNLIKMIIPIKLNNKFINLVKYNISLELKKKNYKLFFFDILYKINYNKN